MSELKGRLLAELGNEEYRKEYAEQHVNALLAAQISTIREQRGLSQSALAEKIDKQQPAISRIENVNYARWNVRTLRDIASALDCWLDIRLESWGKLVAEADSFNPESLRRERYEDDPIIFGSEAREPVPESIRWMQKDLFPWLQSSGNTAQMSRWLQGLDLPAFGDADPPFLWIVRAIEAEPAHSRYRKLLIDRTLALLSPEENVPRQPDEVLNGALAILANFPSEGGWELLKDWNAHPTRSKRKLPTVSLPVFLSALIRNQADGSLEDEWMDTIERGYHKWLPAVELDGFEGLKWMPPAHSSVRIDALSKGLRKLGLAMRLRPNAVIDLRAVMEGLKGSFQSRFFAEMLLRAGVSINWPVEVVDAWTEVFANDPEETKELFARIAPKERSMIHAIVGAHRTAVSISQSVPANEEAGTLMRA